MVRWRRRSTTGSRAQLLGRTSVAMPWRRAPRSSQVESLKFPLRVLGLLDKSDSLSVNKGQELSTYMYECILGSLGWGRPVWGCYWSEFMCHF